MLFYLVFDINLSLSDGITFKATIEESKTNVNRYYQFSSLARKLVKNALCPIGNFRLA
jgi:hypothetical protein